MAKEDRYNTIGDSGLDGDTDAADADEAGSNPSPEPDKHTRATPQQQAFDADDIPLIFRRQGHGVKFRRDTAITVYLLDRTSSDLTEMLRVMEDHFETDEVQKLDVYEAVVRNGLGDSGDLDVDGVAEVLTEFGYGLGE